MLMFRCNRIKTLKKYSTSTCMTHISLTTLRQLMNIFVALFSIAFKDYTISVGVIPKKTWLAAGILQSGGFYSIPIYNQLYAPYPLSPP